MNWRRVDTLFLRLFLLMWFTLVASHLVAYLLSVPLTEGRAPEVARLDPARLPPLPSLPPGGIGGVAERGGPPPAPSPPAARPIPPALPAAVLWLDYGLRALVIGLGAFIGARWLSAPMRRLARGAQALVAGLARGEPPPPLDVRRGTVEVRETTRLFNDMARRLGEQFNARGLHLAAVSHDVRTPLTRLRMRLEALPPDVRDAAARDIQQIDELLDATLAVLREQQAGTPPTLLDPAALLQAVVDDLAEQGVAVALDAPAGLRARAHPAALRRIVDNLIGNALRHAGSARLSLAEAGATMLAIHVDDDGPGIAPGAQETVFQPWVRLAAIEAGPRAGQPGHGLGLAIARDLAERDGGTLTLANRPGGGLRATLALPRA